MAQPTAYQRVVDEYDITEAGVTSLEYLSFDGADDWVSNGTWVGGSISQPTTGIVATHLKVAKNGLVFGSQDFSARHQFYTGVSGDIIQIFAGAVLAAPNNTRLPETAIYRTVFNGASSSVSSNGTVLRSGNAGAYLSSGLQLGGESDSQVMDFYGIVFIDRLLTTDEITNTEAYLAARSGVTL